MHRPISAERPAGADAGVGGPALVVTHLRDALLLAPPPPWRRRSGPRLGDLFPGHTTHPRGRAGPVRRHVARGVDNSPAMPQAPKPVVSALIVSHNAKDLLLQCMQALFTSADVPVEAVVVDNDSSDGPAAAVTAEFPQATVLIQERNLGV